MGPNRQQSRESEFAWAYVAADSSAPALYKRAVDPGTANAHRIGWYVFVSISEMLQCAAGCIEACIFGSLSCLLNNMEGQRGSILHGSSMSRPCPSPQMCVASAKLCLHRGTGAPLQLFYRSTHILHNDFDCLLSISITQKDVDTRPKTAEKLTSIVNLSS